MTQRKKENELDPNTQLEKQTFVCGHGVAARLSETRHCEEALFRDSKAREKIE